MTLTASPETDLAVAMACGIEPKFGWVPIEASTAATTYAQLPFRPSTDLNDAFLAAEKFGLFDAYKHARTLEQLPDGFWEMTYGGRFDENECPAESTPALAICAAILAVAENSHEEKP